MSDERDELADVKNRAEKFIAVHAEMIRIGQGVGGLSVERMSDFDAWYNASNVEHADTVLAVIEATKPRTINSADELDDLPFGSAVQTSDATDVVVLKCEDGYFRNQSGYTVSVPILWQFGIKPFTVIFEGQA